MSEENYMIKNFGVGVDRPTEEEIDAEYERLLNEEESSE